MNIFLLDRWSIHGALTRRVRLTSKFATLAKVNGTYPPSFNNVHSIYLNELLYSGPIVNPSTIDSRVKVWSMIGSSLVNNQPILRMNERLSGSSLTDEAVFFGGLYLHLFLLHRYFLLFLLARRSISTQQSSLSLQPDRSGSQHLSIRFQQTL